jgi:hypothetical protein
MSTLRALLVLSALAIATSSCAAPLQNGGVVVLPGGEARLDLMCRYRDAQEVCASLAEE